MDKDIFASILRFNEAIASDGIEPFDLTLCHCQTVVFAAACACVNAFAAPSEKELERPIYDTLAKEFTGPSVEYAQRFRVHSRCPLKDNTYA